MPKASGSNRGFSSIVGTSYESTFGRSRQDRTFSVLSVTQIKSLNNSQLSAHINAAKSAAFMRNPEAQNTVKDKFRSYIDALVEERKHRS